MILVLIGNGNRSSLSWRRADVQIGADHLGPGEHAMQAEAVRRQLFSRMERLVKSTTIIRDNQITLAVILNELNPDIFSVGMSRDIGQCFLGNAKDLKFALAG